MPKPPPLAVVVYYITQIKPLYQQSFWMDPNDNNEINKVEIQVLTSRPTLFLLAHYPNNIIGNDELSAIEKMLFLHGYNVEIKTDYKIYYPEQ